MRHQLKPKTPSARARMSYILRTDRYGVKVSQVADLAAAGVANLPAWADGPAGFWSAVDGYERKNARLCLELELNLPRELSRDGQVAAIADYIDRLTDEAGAFPITWSIHDSNDGNPHCHLMLQERPLDGRELDGPKAHFHRADKKRPERSGVAKSRWWHSKQNVFWSRALWADACNQQLLAAGHTARFDPRKKSERLDEALRAGNLRAAAALCTQTERHEGAAIGAVRRQVAAGQIVLAELPEGVAHIITSNDMARHYNCWLRDWAREARQSELRLFLADHLHDLRQQLDAESPSGHVAARATWMEQQHAEALAEEAERLRLHGLLSGSLGRGLRDGWLDRASAQAVLDELAEAPSIAGLREAVASVSDLWAEHEWRVAREREQAHAEALAEDATRTRCLRQTTALVGQGQAVGWLGDDEADELLYTLIDPHTLVGLRELLATVSDMHAEYEWRMTTLDAPVTLVDHDTSESEQDQWLIEHDEASGLTLGWWSNDADTLYRYDHDADDWVEYDLDHHPTNGGSRMG